MKKIIDEKGRLFGVISPLDLVVPLAVAAVALMAYGRFGRDDDPSLGNQNVFAPKTGELVYTVYVPKLREDLSQTVRVGDPLRNNESDTAFGVITDVQRVPCVQTEVGPDGTAVNLEVEGYTGLILTGRMDGNEIDGRFYLSSNHQIYLSQKIYFGTPYNVFAGLFMTIEQAAD